MYREVVMKLETAQLIEKNQGKVVRYRGQDFKVCFDSVSYLSPKGMWIKAIEEGRVRKGDSQFVTRAWLLNQLRKGVLATRHAEPK
jgi:hypothetical protein